MAVVLQGLMHVHGQFGAGKSTLGWTASTNPKKIVYIDGGTSKERPIANSLQLDIVQAEWKEIKAGSYIDLGLMTAGKTDLEAFEIAKDVIEDLPNGLEAVILDDVYPLWVGAHPYVRGHRDEFRSGGMKGSGEMIGGMEWQAVRKMLLPGLYTQLQGKAKLVIFLSREKPARDSGGNVLPGLTVPDADVSLNAASQLTIRLIHNTREISNVPTGLVVKNARTIDAPKREVIQVFPKRIAKLTWAEIERYTKEPIGDRQPTKEETPDETELNSILGVLSPAQQAQYELSMQLAMTEVREEMEAAVKEALEASEIPNPSMRAAAVYSQLHEQFPMLTKEYVEGESEAMAE